MIQDIFPHELKNEFASITPDSNSNTNSNILIYNNQKILVKVNDGNIEYPTDSDIKDEKINPIYMFKIDNTEYYLGINDDRFSFDDDFSIGDYGYEKINLLRSVAPKHEAFAGVTGYQLYNWYRDNKFCGRCGKEMVHSDKERMMHCDHCNNMVYPRINPAVIVAITNGDNILLTRYAGRDYKKYALVAGFTEIGESIEQTVSREVMEEVGLKIKNIKYYKSQPWGFSGCLLLGFWAEVDGSADIVLDENELAEGIWVSREELQVDEEEISLTRDMINCFKLGNQ